MLARLLASPAAGGVTTVGVADAAATVAVAVTGPPPMAPLRLDRRVLSGAAPAAPFRPTPARCRRAIGLDAVDACLRGRHRSAAEAVASVLAGAEDAYRTGERAPWWAAWWAGLGAGGRAVVQAEAVAWATRLWTGVDWQALTSRPVIVSRDDRWRCPSARWLTVHGRVDVLVPGGTDRGGSASLVVGSGPAPPAWAAALALPALVAALTRGAGATMARVVGWWPDTGQVRVLPVDDRVLGSAAATVAASASAWRGHPDWGQQPRLTA